MTGMGVLLLTPESDYAPKVLICGGLTLEDTKEPHEFSAKDSASDQCLRLLRTPEGIKRGWQVEHMPQPRMMPNAVVIMNGVGSGLSGYANMRNQVGMSNVDNTVRTAVLYEPTAPAGRSFSQGILESVIPRMYHSTAMATLNGDVMTGGSNPDLDRSEVAYGTGHRVEWLRLPYCHLRIKQKFDYVTSPKHPLQSLARELPSLNRIFPCPDKSLPLQLLTRELPSCG